MKRQGTDKANPAEGAESSVPPALFMNPAWLSGECPGYRRSVANRRRMTNHAIASLVSTGEMAFPPA